MTPNKRDLKAYSRFDGTGRIVPGSTVLRRNKPKVGKWKEVQAYECCNAVEPTTRLASISFAPNSNFFFIDCIDTIVFTNNNYSGTTAEQWLEYFNLHFKWIGTFSLNPETPTQVFLDIKTEILNSFCTSGVPVFCIGAA